MKAEMPIVIALALVLSLIIATIYYTTSTLTYISASAGSEQGMWSMLGDELDSIILATLSRLGNQSSTLFYSTFWSNYKEAFYNLTPLQRLNNTAYREIYYDPVTGRYVSCPTKMAWSIVYDYDDYKCFGLCEDYTSPGFNNSLSSFLNAVNLSSQMVANNLSSNLYNALLNWANIMSRLGYVVYSNGIGVNVTYTTVITSDSATGASYSWASLHIDLFVDVYNPYLGYKRITRFIEIGFNATFQQGYWKYDGLYLPVYVSAYVNLNGVVSNYIVNPSTTTLTVYSGSLRLLNFTSTSNGNITLQPVASYYYGNGTTYLVYRIPINKSYQWPWLQEVVVWSNLVLSSAYCDDSYPPPYSLSQPDPPRNSDNDTARRKVTVAYLWAGLLNVDIMGFNLTNGLKIVFKYYANTKPPSGDWVDSVPFDLYGDERASFPPGTVV
jgi:hypothetical protein